MNGLLDNAKEFIASAEDNFTKSRYNAAVSDYFKAIVIYCDYKLNSEMKILPKNHVERFELLQKYYPNIYSLVSKIFRKYTDSYNIRLEKKDVLLMRENAEKIKSIIENKNR